MVCVHHFSPRVENVSVCLPHNRSGCIEFLRKQGIPCSLYIDDRLNGELLTKSGPWSILYSDRREEFRVKAATAAIFIVLSVLVELGILYPMTSLEYLGFLVDSLKQAFVIPQRKIVAWASLREKILACKKSVDIKSLQRFQGKCISLSLAVPAAKLSIREMSHAIASASSNGLVPLSQALRSELIHWRFQDTWRKCVPWRGERHLRLSVSLDALRYGWGAVFHESSGDRALRDYWGDCQKGLNISTKEMLALVNSTGAAPKCVRDCRVDAFVDSQVLIDSWYGQGSRKSLELTNATKHVFFVLAARNLQLNLFHVSLRENRADGPSRTICLSDSKLSLSAWAQVAQAFGGVTGHTFDLMALESNAVCGRDGVRLPHFSPTLSPRSLGVNLFCQDLGEMDNMSNPYVFPPFALLGPVLKFLYRFGIPFTVVVPVYFPRPFWWPELMARSSAGICLGTVGEIGVLQAPSRSGYTRVPCPCSLWAFWVSRF